MRVDVENPEDLSKKGVVKVYRTDKRQIYSIEHTVSRNDVAIQAQSIPMTEIRKKPPTVKLVLRGRELKSRDMIIEPWKASAFSKAIRGQTQRFHYGFIVLIRDELGIARPVEALRVTLELHILQGGSEHWTVQIDDVYVFGDNIILIIDDERRPVPTIANPNNRNGPGGEWLRLASFGADVEPLIKMLSTLEILYVEVSKQNSRLKIAEMDATTKSLKDLETDEGESGLASAIISTEVPPEMQINGVLEDAIRGVLDTEGEREASQMAIARAANQLGVPAHSMWQKVLKQMKTVVPESWEKIRVRGGRTIAPIPGLPAMRDFVEVIDQVRERVAGALGVTSNLLSRSKERTVEGVRMEQRQLDASVLMNRNNMEEIMEALYDLELAPLDAKFRASKRRETGRMPPPVTMKIHWGGMRVRDLNDLKMAAEIVPGLANSAQFKRLVMEAIGMIPEDVGGGGSDKEED